MIWANSVLGTKTERPKRPSRCFHCGGSALVEATPNCPVCGRGKSRRPGQPWAPPVTAGRTKHGDCIMKGDWPAVVLPAHRIEVFRIVPPYGENPEHSFSARLGHFVGSYAPHPDLAVAWFREELEEFLRTASACRRCGAKHSVRPFDRLQTRARCELGCGARFTILPAEVVASWRPCDQLNTETFLMDASEASVFTSICDACPDVEWVTFDTRRDGMALDVSVTPFPLAELETLEERVRSVLSDVLPAGVSVRTLRILA